MRCSDEASRGGDAAFARDFMRFPLGRKNSLFATKNSLFANQGSLFGFSGNWVKTVAIA
jgi:hypothetical protein